MLHQYYRMKSVTKMLVIVLILVSIHGTIGNPSNTSALCVRSYLEREVCDGASMTRICMDSACTSSKRKYSWIKKANNVQTCNCTLQDDTPPNGCNMTNSERKLCIALLAYGLFPSSTVEDCECPTKLAPNAARFEVRIVQMSNSCDEYVAQIGESKELTCEAATTDDLGCQTPTLRWFYEGAEISSTTEKDGVRVQSSGNRLNLIIKEIKDTDGGSYMCWGSLQGQQDSKSVQVVIYKKPELLSKKEQFGTFGKDGKVECKVEGKPTPVVYWKFINETDIPNSDKYVIQNEFLTIKNLTMDDDKTYLCFVEVLSQGDVFYFPIDYTVLSPSPATNTSDTCTRSYLAREVCDGSSMTCIDDACTSAKRKYSMIKTANNVQTCDCTLQEDTPPDSCNMTNSERSLCFALLVNGLLPSSTLKECDCLTTLIPPTTAPYTRYCYYTKNRPASLTSRSKRLYQGTDVSQDCEYPGIVGLFQGVDTGSPQAVCMAFLITEDTLLVDVNCKLSIESFTLWALAKTYSVASLSTSLPQTDAATIQQLNAQTGAGYLYTVQLTSPLTFDSSCVQPVCFPCNGNGLNINSSFIDFSNCRVLGYGDTTDDYAANQPSVLQEVHVQVNPTQLTGTTLDIVRNDAGPTTVCGNEYGAPLLCSHALSGEWIAVGFYRDFSLMCSSGNYQKEAAHGFLVESMASLGHNGYYDALGKTPYTCRLE